MKLIFKVIGGLILAVVLGVAGVLYLQPRPQDTTAPAVYETSGHGIDYCQKAELDGSGLSADDIPKAYTPSCGFTQVPAPILAGCTEPLSAKAADLRGLWQAVDGKTGHVERIEQCGDRVVVAGASFIHDFRADGTLKNGANDINPVLCARIRAAVNWNDSKQLQFKPYGLRVMVTRHLEDEDTLVWTYGDGQTSRLKRICKWPAAEG